MDFRYLTPLVYPSRYANRLQVIKMSEAFSRRTDSFCLYVRELRSDLTKIFSDYQINSAFKIEALGTPLGFPRSLFLAIRSRGAFRASENAVFFMRDGWLAYWLSFFHKLDRERFFFEVHAFERLPKFVYRRIFPLALGLITTNENKARDIQKYFGVPKEKLLTALNGVDASAFSNLLSPPVARTKLSLPLDKKLIVYTGTPSEEKGIKTLLDASELLWLDTRIISVGGSKKDFDRFRGDKNFEKIIWISQVAHDKIPDYIASADLLAAPFSGKSSWTTFYTSPLKIPEYLASGKAIIASDLPSIREFVSKKEVFFFKADDASDFAEVAKRAFQNPKIMLEKGDSAKAKALEFSWDSRAGRILDFIENKIKSK